MRGCLLRDAIRALPGGVLGGFDLLPALTAQDAYETADRVSLPARGLHNLRQVAPLARFIRAITSAFLLARDSVAPLCARARCEALAGDFFDRVLSVPTGAAGGATSGDRCWTASQIRVTAIFRLVNFLTSFKCVERRHAREAVPGVDQAGCGPFRGEFGQFLCAGKRL